MFSLLDRLVRRIVEQGDLTIIGADGQARRYGDGSGEPIVVALADRRIEAQIAVDPQLALGEAFMSGRLQMRSGSIYDLLALVLSNAERRGLPAWTMRLDGVRFLLRRIAQFNPAARARRNVAHHYDLPAELYDLFLDQERQYSCAYFDEAGEGDEVRLLDDAQRAKMRHIAAKLQIEPGHRVLDIGAGWGGLALYLARNFDADVTGITLSQEQLAWARDRAASERAAVRFDLKDYRGVADRYDRIVSVGMFEHVGAPHYKAYFSQIRRLLADDGVALVHAIGRSTPPTATNPFIARYIFPGGYIPALSETLAGVERAGLIATDVEILRLHYARTLRAWRLRFLANRSCAARLMGEEFCRMWEFYLAASETAFRYQKLVVFQLQLVRRIDALPIRRDYMHHREALLSPGDREQPAQDHVWPLATRADSPHASAGR